MRQDYDQPQPERSQDPQVEQARNTIIQLLAKRQKGEQLTSDERRVFQAARDVLTNKGKVKDEPNEKYKAVKEDYMQRHGYE